MKVDGEELTGEDREGDIYEDEVMDELEEDDEITPEEEGFMKGYEAGSKMSRCPRCGKAILEDFVEKEMGGEVYRFCSDSCARDYKPMRG